MRTIGRENRDSVPRAQSIDSFLVRLRVALRVRGVGSEGCVEAIVGFGDVLVEMGTDCREFGARGADHGEATDFAAAPEVEEGEADYADFLVAEGLGAVDEAGCVFACADHAHI